MTVKIRLEALPGHVAAAVLWLKSTGAKLTGMTQLFPITHSDEMRVYAVMTPPIENEAAGRMDRAALAQQARQRAQEFQAAGDAIQAAYYQGLADGLETGFSPATDP